MPDIKSFIYKGKKKSDSYLYLVDKDDFSCIPDSLLTMLGSLDFVMELELNSQRKLAQADIQKVLSSLHEQGYYLQLSDISTINMINYKISG